MKNKEWAEKLMCLAIKELSHTLCQSTQGHITDYKKIIKSLSDDDEYKSVINT